MNKSTTRVILPILLLMLVAVPFISGCQKKRDLTAFKDFAENSIPSLLPGSGIPHLPQVPPEVLPILKNVRKQEEKEIEKYLTLLILRTYRAQHACCHMSYELRKEGTEEDFLLDAYKRVIGGSRNWHVELLDGSIAYNWVEKHPELLDYVPVRKEYEILKSIFNRFEKKNFDYRDSDWAGLEKLARERELRMKDLK